MESHHRPASPHMRYALDLAERALGTTSPNPTVGAVVASGSKVVGEGFTQPPGGPHAEIEALRNAGESARGATLYVTLEPCNHHGRTPPCTDAILASGVDRVRIAVRDPNPDVPGGGVERLRDAGIDVRVGDGASEARKLMEAFFKHSTTKLPFVTAKFAASLDGKIATRSGDSKWITGGEARRYVHTLRARSDAIMAGINTVLADDPQLTARDENNEPVRNQPLRVIVDGKGRIPPGAALLRQPGESLIAVCCGNDRARDLTQSIGTEVVNFPDHNGIVDLGALLRMLGERDVTSVFVEGGGTLLGSLFDARLVDKVVGFIAPVIIGGTEAPGPVGGLGAGSMAEALRLRDVRMLRFEFDTAIEGYCEG